MRTIRFTFLSLLSSLLAGCAAAGDDRGRLIETIEDALVLPSEAAPLASYERYYADRDGVILAVLINHSDEHRQAVAQHCRTLSEAPFPCPLNSGELRLVDAGESTWVEDWKELPGMSGGGCAQVEIEYLPNERTFFRAECNGPY
ncbi:hypothetical protein PK98_14660 [Croceibacterium mercuriale]|uniref:Lipoprotein n=1 Tax=Croceibacterium mercuriale TaxID=1572751 RepID=A0A0B2BS79_9SPHN|nr:hypothetical protein [Croceibacterium mercuriale]KHL24224.1 hypothetical protein PK98_14660 [Croceibacterium mercuriale]